ncbi:MAG: sulfatase-like hydrolase/transferase [Candidatus Aminicenantes bacterium]|nr:sulfatase-like hydrolase/transferase [Candidatus Aminicenantes bacterium]
MKKPKILFLIGIVVGLVIIGVIFCLFFWPERKPAQEFATLLAKNRIDKLNIVLITLDTTRADHLPCYGYSGVKTPHLDSLANRSILFEQCTASSPLTLPSHASMMTGLYPTYHGVRVNGNTALSGVHLTLAELFAQQGYQCGAFIGAFVLDGRWGLKQGFNHYDDRFDLRKYKQLDLGLVQRPGNEVVNAALSWMENQKENPFFTWIHLFDPHAPYEPPEPYFSEYNTGISGLYDGEIAFTDEQIGRIISWLDKNGLGRKTIIAIMGDHGEGLGDHNEMAHGYYIYDYAVQVPFLIATPFEDFHGIRISSQVRTIDLYPTVLEMVGIEVPEENQGESVLDMIFHPDKNKDYYAYCESLTPNIHYGWSPLYSLRTVKYKFIDAPRPELYDLIEDPKELNNVRDKFPKIAQKFKEVLDQIIEESSLEAPKPEAANLDHETLQRLAALGYIGAPVSKRSSHKNGKRLADPKDKLHIYESVQRVGELFNREEYTQATEILESVLQEEPKIPQALLLLATCYTELDRREEAKAQYDIILKDDPNSIQALIGLANLLSEEGKKEDVIALCKQILSVDNRNTQAYTILGEVYIEENDHSTALPYLEKAVEIQPKLTRNRLNLAVCFVGLNQYDRAENILKDILIEYPKFPLAYYHLGLLYEEQGKLEEALKAYSEEVTLYPNHFKARFNLGKLLYKFGDQKGYIEQMREVIRIAPEAAEGYLFLARGLLYESNDINQILELVQKGLPLAKSSELKAFGYFLLADIYSRKNQPEKVKEALKKANYYKSR